MTNRKYLGILTIIGLQIHTNLNACLTTHCPIALKNKATYPIAIYNNYANLSALTSYKSSNITLKDKDNTIVTSGLLKTPDSTQVLQGDYINVSGYGCGEKDVWNVVIAYNKCGTADTVGNPDCIFNPVKLNLELYGAFGGDCISPAGKHNYSKDNLIKNLSISGMNDDADCWETTASLSAGVPRYFVEIKYKPTNGKCRGSRRPSLASEMSKTNAEDYVLQNITNTKTLTSDDGFYHTEFIPDSETSSSLWLVGKDGHHVKKLVTDLTDGNIPANELFVIDNGAVYFTNEACTNKAPFAFNFFYDAQKFTLSADGLNLVDFNGNVLWRSNEQNSRSKFTAYSFSPTQITCELKPKSLRIGSRMRPGDQLVSNNLKYNMQLEYSSSKSSRMCIYSADSQEPQWCSKELSLTSPENGGKIYADMIYMTPDSQGSMSLKFITNDPSQGNACMRLNAAEVKTNIGSTDPSNVYVVLTDEGKLAFQIQREFRQIEDADIHLGNSADFPKDCKPKREILAAGKSLDPRDPFVYSPSKKFTLSVRRDTKALCIKKNSIDEELCAPIIKSTDGVTVNTLVFGGNKGETYLTNSECPDVKFAVANKRNVEETDPETGETVKFESVSEVLAKADKIEMGDDGYVHLIDSAGNGIADLSPNQIQDKDLPLFEQPKNEDGEIQEAICHQPGMKRKLKKK